MHLNFLIDWGKLNFVLNDRKHFHSKGFGNLDLEMIFFTFCYVNRNQVQRPLKPSRLLNIGDHAPPNGNMQPRRIKYFPFENSCYLIDMAMAYSADTFNFHASLTHRLSSFLCWQNFSGTLIFGITQVSIAVIEPQLNEKKLYCTRCLL